MSEGISEGGRKVRKAVILALIDLTDEAENKSREELETEIRKVVGESLESIPWIVVENVIIVEE